MKYSKSKLILTVIFICGLITLVVLGSFAIFTTTKTSDKVQVIRTNEVEAFLSNVTENGSIVLNNIIPLTDELGLEQSGATLQVENITSSNLNIRIIIMDDKTSYETNNIITYDSNGLELVNNSLDNSVIKYNLEKNNTQIETNLLSRKNTYCSNPLIIYNDCVINKNYESGRVIYEDELSANATNSYKLKLWLNYSAGNEYQNKAYYGKVKIIINKENACFGSNTSGTINEYKCGINNLYGYEPNLDITIPGTISGDTITTIASGTFANMNINSIIFPNSITTINSEAFSGYNGSSLTINNNIASIGENAFRLNTNKNLRAIYNLTGKSFNWLNILDGTSYQALTAESTINNGQTNDNKFTTGTVIIDDVTINILSSIE